MNRSPPPTVRVASRPFTDTHARSRRDGGVRSCPEPSLYDFAGMAAVRRTCSSPLGEGRRPFLHMGEGYRLLARTTRCSRCRRRCAVRLLRVRAHRCCWAQDARLRGVRLGARGQGWSPGRRACVAGRWGCRTLPATGPALRPRGSPGVFLRSAGPAGRCSAWWAQGHKGTRAQGAQGHRGAVLTRTWSGPARSKPSHRPQQNPQHGPASRRHRVTFRRHIGTWLGGAAPGSHIEQPSQQEARSPPDQGGRGPSSPRCGDHGRPDPTRPDLASAISRSNRASQSMGVEWSTDSGGSYSASWRIWRSDSAASRQINAP